MPYSFMRYANYFLSFHLAMCKLPFLRRFSDIPLTSLWKELLITALLFLLQISNTIMKCTYKEKRKKRKFHFPPRAKK